MIGSCLGLASLAPFLGGVGIGLYLNGFSALAREI